MKLLLIAALAVSGFAASAEGTASKMRDQLLGAANILAESQNENGACGGEMEAYTSEIVKYVVDAKNYHDYLDITAAMNLPAAVEEAVGSLLSVKEATSEFIATNPELAGTVFYGPAPGAYGNMSKIEFTTDTEVLLWTLNVEGDGMPKWESETGTYSVRAVTHYQIEVTVVTDGEVNVFMLQKSWNEYGKQWYIVPANKSDANPYFDGYVEFPSECDA